MRHGKKFNHLGRQKGHRKAMLSNMAVSLIEHKKISTTVAKAKALRQFVEPLITKAKTDNMHSRRTVFSYLQKKDAVKELFSEVVAKVGDRPGGYTRILKTGTRLGDNADTCIIELVDFNENMLTTAKPKKTRRRKAAPKKAEVKAEETAVVEDATVVEEAPKTEEPKAEEPKVEEAKADTTEAPKAEDTKEDSSDEEKKDDNKTE